MQEIQGLAVDTSEAVAAQPTYLHVMRLLWRRRQFLSAITLAGLVLSLLVAFLIPKEYTSTAALLPPDPRSMTGPNSLGESESAGAAATVTAPTLRSPNALFIGILNSRTIQDDLIHQFDLRRVYRVRDEGSARKKLASKTTIDDDKETGNLTIKVADRDPSRARDLNAAYLADLDKLIVQMSTSTARREAMFLEDRLKSVKADLDATERALSQYSSRSATVSPDAQERAALENISRVQADLIAAEAELHALEATYEANNVRVRAAQAKVAELRSQLQRMSEPDKDVPVPSGDAESLPSIRKLPLLGAAYSDLYRNATLQESLYAMLTKQYETAKVEEAKEIPTVRVLDPPDLPERKSSPHRVIIVISGALLSLILAALWIVGNAVWNVVDDDDPRKSFLHEVGTDLRSSFTPGKRGLNHSSGSIVSK